MGGTLDPMATVVDQHEVPHKLLADASEPEINGRGLPGSTRGFDVIAPNPESPCKPSSPGVPGFAIRSRPLPVQTSRSRPGPEGSAPTSSRLMVAQNARKCAKAVERWAQLPSSHSASAGAGPALGSSFEQPALYQRVTPPSCRPSLPFRGERPSRLSSWPRAGDRHPRVLGQRMLDNQVEWAAPGGS